MTQTTEKRMVVEVRDLKKCFPSKRTITDAIAKKPAQVLTAVDGVSLEIREGETLGLVGESGCGKSTLARTLLRLYEPDGGQIFFNGVDVTNMKGTELRKQRRDFQMIFQDPYSSLNPRKSVRATLEEALRVHNIIEPGPDQKERIERRIYTLLDLVGMNRNSIDRYPGEFSGGQRQRIGIARALAVNPSFIVADEPVSALDVSIQAQVLNLLTEIQAKENLAFLFISHDLRVVRLISHQVAVMYLGKVIEYAPTEDLYETPHHPYTQILMKAAPVLDATNRNRDYAIEGEPPSPLNLPTGCRFHPRCPYATDKCREEQPELREVAPGCKVACHYPLNLPEQK
ncbi:ABC transporter ATP-binding protein [Lawsonibacter celer]|jgi:oligopeptide/dipeptide ABC transporter ATP-binding protein|uniref:ABC transporter ATP-binding protein n=1 Tax=Lawsonibacter celer TaxID=2986526 RepID=UPI00164920B7|nr:ABC transporter ATP-binding protein [Lawsonibacter celer]